MKNSTSKDRLRKSARLDEEVRERQERIRALLLSGKSVAEICKIVSITAKRVYHVAHRDNLPTNPIIHPKSEDENSIARMLLAGWTEAQIGRYMNQSELAVSRIRDRIANNPVLPDTITRYGEAKRNDPRR